MHAVISSIMILAGRQISRKSRRLTGCISRKSASSIKIRKGCPKRSSYYNRGDLHPFVIASRRQSNLPQLRGDCHVTLRAPRKDKKMDRLVHYVICGMFLRQSKLLTPQTDEFFADSFEIHPGSPLLEFHSNPQPCRPYPAFPSKKDIKLNVKT
jgi:hypothetical protein